MWAPCWPHEAYYLGCRPRSIDMSLPYWEANQCHLTSRLTRITKTRQMDRFAYRIHRFYTYRILFHDILSLYASLIFLYTLMSLWIYYFPAVSYSLSTMTIYEVKKIYHIIYMIQYNAWIPNWQYNRHKNDTSPYFGEMSYLPIWLSIIRRDYGVKLQRSTCVEPGIRLIATDSLGVFNTKILPQIAFAEHFLYVNTEFHNICTRFCCNVFGDYIIISSYHSLLKWLFIQYMARIWSW